MAKFCTNCGKELDENAALCLNCGVLVGNNTSNNNTNKEKKRGLPTWAIVLIVVGCFVLIPLILVTVIAVSAFNMISNTDFDIDDYIEETVIQEGTTGDTLTTDNFKITLIDALTYSSIDTNEYYMDIPAEGKEYIVFFFNVENVSDKSQYISDFDFTGYVDGYEIETEYLYNEINGIGDLDATLSPNKKAKGYVAFEVDTTWQEFELHYSGWFDNEELVFRIVNEDDTNVIGA